MRKSFCLREKKVRKFSRIQYKSTGAPVEKWVQKSKKLLFGHSEIRIQIFLLTNSTNILFTVQRNIETKKFSENSKIRIYVLIYVHGP